MAFDGIVIANLVKEFSDALTGGKIAKITQTERDELLFTIKNFRETKRLLLSVNASLPLAYLTDTNKQGPMTAPNFCMLLRKHIGSGRIVSASRVWNAVFILRSNTWTRWVTSAASCLLSN